LCVRLWDVWFAANQGGSFEEIAVAATQCDLWRGVHSSEMAAVEDDKGPTPGVLTPTLVRKRLEDDSYREADVRIVEGLVQTGGGTSLFDKDKFFKGKKWLFFMIPKGTEIDPALKLTGPDYNPRFKANHYQIEVTKPITVEAYVGALDNFARAAYAKRYVDARSNS
jgi:hypothetical protein